MDLTREDLKRLKLRRETKSIESNGKYFRAVATQNKEKPKEEEEFSWCDGIVVGACASQSVDLGFISQVESYQKTTKNSIHSFPAWRSAQKVPRGEQAGKFACCVLGQGT